MRCEIKIVVRPSMMPRRRGEDALFGLRVHGGKGIVEDQDARIADDGAGDGAALFLSAGESDAAFADDGFVFVGEAFDVGVEVCDFSGGADLIDAVIR